MALASGAADKAGQQAWARLSALVRRSFQRGQGQSPEAPAVSSGEAELERLEEAPNDPARRQAAQALSAALAARAAEDPDFDAALQQWHEQVRPVRTGDGDVNVTISGGEFHGPQSVVRDVYGVPTVTPPPPSPGAGTPPGGE
ncbi:hypothetical protein DDE74_39765 [Streptomyces lydicus]|uniref:Uncharacterized protein n=1 Tax=Streptomyces lydicus TaxID=47763 RepID=A0A3Q9KGI9_9ACTN|nr:hypothetical protein DDE74_39765 [Streptomyces lydicus]